MSEKIEKIVEYELEKGNLAGASIYVIKDGRRFFLNNLAILI